jgi:hypothetical protein
MNLDLADGIRDLIALVVVVAGVVAWVYGV